MRRFGTALLILLGFIAGIAFVHSCGGGGGGGNDAYAQDMTGVRSNILILNSSNSYTDSWQPHLGSETFLVKDIRIYAPTAMRIQITNGADLKWFGYNDSGILCADYHYESGIYFNSGEAITATMSSNPAEDTYVLVMGYVMN